MKKIIFGLMLLACLAVKAETTGNIVGETIDTISSKANQAASYVDTSSTLKTIYSDVRSAVIGLSAGLKVGAEHVYEVLVKQQVVNAITWLIVGVLSLVTILIGIYIINVTMEKAEEGTAEIVFTIGIIIIILGTIPFLGMLFNIDTIVTGFVNPEYGAIKDIIDFIK